MKTELDISRTVKKSNILNELRNANASLVEYRLFCVYLAHLPIDSEDTVVAFSLSDYARIAGLGRPRYDDLEAQSHNILKMTALIKNDDGGFTNRNLFSEFKLFREDEQWMVSLECNPKIAPMIREQKGRFLRYKLYNTIYLKSFNQQRIYELLKQYETIGSRTENLDDLRAYLSIGEKEYPLWYVFARDVLKVAQKALKEHTDIYFEYEPVKKGKKVVAVKFDIFKNDEFVDQLHIDDFLPKHEIDVVYNGKGVFARAEDNDDGDPVCHFVEPEEISPEDQLRQDRIQTVLAIMRQKHDYDEDEAEEIVVAAEQSEWWNASEPALSNNSELREKAFRNYVEAQYMYSKVRSTSQTRFGFLKYLTGAVRENYTKVLVIGQEHSSSVNGSFTAKSFDTSDFFQAAVKRSLGEDFDFSILD